MFFKNPLLRVPFRYGLIGGVIGGLAIVVLYLMGMHPFLLPVIVDFRIAIYSLFIFLCLKELRDYFYKGELYFWQGMVGSYVFVATAALIGAVVTWCYATCQKEFLSAYVAKLQQQLTGFKKQFIESVGVDAYNQQLARLPGTTAFDLAGDYFLKSLIIGLFLAILFSVVVRKTPKTN